MQLHQQIIKIAKKSNMGHIGSALSVIDLIAVLYNKILDISTVKNSNRDRFILSKGHSALALYVVLHSKGLISEEELNNYGQNSSKLGVHPEHFVKGVDFSTGSLGHGIAIAVGSALAGKIQKSSHMIYCLISDGELNEGSFWEAILFASHHQLSNLVIILDNNGQQAMGLTSDILKIENIAKKIHDFGFNSCEIDGHNLLQIENSLQKIKDDFKNNILKKPSFIVANTISGKNISFMEKTIEWHYKSMNDQQYQLALAELLKKEQDEK